MKLFLKNKNTGTKSQSSLKKITDVKFLFFWLVFHQNNHVNCKMWWQKLILLLICYGHLVGCKVTILLYIWQGSLFSLTFLSCRELRANQFNLWTDNFFSCFNELEAKRLVVKSEHTRYIAKDIKSTGLVWRLY